MNPFSKAAGEALREARQRRGLTLHDVQQLSDGRFKASSLGGYERGERTLTIPRFCELANLYGEPADRLLASTLRKMDPEGRGQVVIDLNRLALIDDRERGVVAEFVHNVRADREDYVTSVITLRSGDVEALSLAVGERPRTLLAKLAPALAGEATAGTGEQPNGDGPDDGVPEGDLS